MPILPKLKAKFGRVISLMDGLNARTAGNGDEVQVTITITLHGVSPDYSLQLCDEWKKELEEWMRLAITKAELRGMADQS